VRPVILVADDDQPTCDLLKDFLEWEGYAADCVRTGPAALARIQAGGLDLALLDWMLPDLGGVDPCQQVREGERGREEHLPIIVVSASGEAQRDTALAAGADTYLPKPFELDDLLDLVVRYVPPAAGQ
jgi:DNA-binding response OmpR family regulator